MGAWGIGPLENDDACDRLVELGENGAETIDEAFQNVLNEAKSDCIDSGRSWVPTRSPRWRS